MVAVGDFADDYLAGYHLQGGREGDGQDPAAAAAIVAERMDVGPTCLLVKGSRSAALEEVLADVQTALEDR